MSHARAKSVQFDFQEIELRLCPLGLAIAYTSSGDPSAIKGPDNLRRKSSHLDSGGSVPPGSG